MDCLDTYQSPKNSINFGSSVEHDFKSPEESIEYLNWMYKTRKNKALLEEQEVKEHARLKKLLDLDLELSKLGVTQLYFPE